MRQSRRVPVPAGQGRHRECGVLGKHPDERVDVGALPGIDVAVHELAELGVAKRAHRLLMALFPYAVLDRRPRALEGAVDRCDGRVSG